ncbi:MAG TPA: AAA family ATPase [Amaricoccus sp.]|uniref:AAA family ATPase n=1 Tax=Amaricoccus sp. TaxID=1872485 RepID=UPI002B689D63|nr:AAA family ATPase [Amaricoccus sp.]HMQ91897.1 AAA family ATPase [Amaricoccus sp.]HMR51279.1 AAA family ATPase [Amaricoccus sp.]HMR59536.1 AAA family ATPase [Amaricoccus sp.]HMT98277.1 AAA family ATPase [Amaricoccus sp.]
MDMTSEATQDDLTRTSLLGFFDPRRMLDPEAQDYPTRLAAVAAAATEVEVGGSWYWALTPDARRKGLRRLPRGHDDRERILATLPVHARDDLGAAFRTLLARRPDPETAAALEGRKAGAAGSARLTAIFQALELLHDAKVPLEGWSAETGMARRLGRAIVLRHKSAASRHLLSGPLRGRNSKLSALVAFAQEGRIDAPPIRLPEAAPAGDVDPGAIPAVVVTGLGGVGKSALLEALRRKLARRGDTLHVTFDLDQAALRSGDRVALTLELLRQIGLANPSLDTQLSGLRDLLRQSLSSATGRESMVEASSAAVFATLSELERVLEGHGEGDTAFLLIFDTFEEALVLGVERVRFIVDWIGMLKGAARNRAVRLILSGREASEIAKHRVPDLALRGELQLGDLGTMAGRAKLRDLFREGGIPHLDLVPDLVAAHGSNPLVLEIVALFCRGRPRDEIRQMAQQEASELRDDLDAEMRQRILYARILNRIGTEEIRRLASPGLVLRRITPKLIEQVLAEPCGLPTPLPPGRAEALFDDLAAHVWLVSRPDGAPRELEHRPDLRRLMLPQVLADPKAREVARRAADWYGEAARAGSQIARFEETYCRALFDPDALPTDAADLRALADHLGSAILDLPGMTARFDEAAGRVLLMSAIGTLDRAGKHRAVTKRRTRQLAEGLERSLLDEAEDPAVAAEEGAATPPDEILQARFAACEFGRVAREAPRLATALLDRILGDDATEPSPSGLQHPAHLAATATLLSDPDADHRRDLAQAMAGWFGAPAQAAGFGDRLALAARTGTGAGPAIATAWVVAGLADLDLRAFLPQEAGETIDRLLEPPADTTLRWRLAQVAGAPGRVLRTRAEVLPLLDPAIVRALGEGRLAVNQGQGLPGKAADLLADLRERRGAVMSSDLLRIENELKGAEITASPDEIPGSLLAALLPGRLPEFHAPLRLLLDRPEPVPGLGAAVAHLAEEVPWWPRGLAATAFEDLPPGPTRAAALIDAADSSGRLPLLARSLAGHSDARREARQIATLIDAVVDRYRIHMLVA